MFITVEEISQGSKEAWSRNTPVKEDIFTLQPQQISLPSYEHHGEPYKFETTLSCANIEGFRGETAAGRPNQKVQM